MNKKQNKGNNSNYRRNNKQTKEDYKYKKEDLGAPKDACNDASWYAANTQLLTDAASLAYSDALGAGYAVAVNPTTKQDWVKSIPGVYAIHCAPSVGISTDNSSAINIAARNIYSFVRHANSGHSNYDSPDLMIYLMAMDSLYSVYSFMVRAYGVLQIYSQKNRYLPSALIKAMGLDFDDFMSSLADFRYYINTCAVKIGSLCVPADMSYMKRHIWMYSQVFADSPSMKAQLYMYTPEYVYAFDGYTDKKGGKLTAQTIYHPGTPLKFSVLKAIVDSLIAKVIEEEDMNIMSGDILKAFSGNVVKLPSINEDFTVLPTFSMEVLSQIQNVGFTGVPTNAGLDTRTIEQDTTGAIIFNPEFNNVSDLLSCKRILNMYKDVVTPADTMVATRLMTIMKDESFTVPGSYTSRVDSCGSDIALYGIMIKYDSNAATNYRWQLYDTIINGVMRTDTDTDLNSVAILLGDLEKFSCHPCLRLCSALGDTSQWLSDVMDVDNYTIVDQSDLRRMHDTALLSMYDVPAMGAFSRKS